jgi:hypothetical protein
MHRILQLLLEVPANRLDYVCKPKVQVARSSSSINSFSVSLPKLIERVTRVTTYAPAQKTSIPRIQSSDNTTYCRFDIVSMDYEDVPHCKTRSCCLRLLVNTHHLCWMKREDTRALFLHHQLAQASMKRTSRLFRKAQTQAHAPSKTATGIHGSWYEYWNAAMQAGSPTAGDMLRTSPAFDINKVDSYYVIM